MTVWISKLIWCKINRTNQLTFNHAFQKFTYDSIKAFEERVKTLHMAPHKKEAKIVEMGIVHLSDIQLSDSSLVRHCQI